MLNPEPAFAFQCSLNTSMDGSVGSAEPMMEGPRANEVHNLVRGITDVRES